ncbi:hypothetical protein GUJ93_ZPchr0009g1809 [Zizania palustris]|uniref:Uncharacterized protein n=1 Tax=Zizania palustris TaxID=103762 RepID=A0A8J5RS24_ZIZPA|nr:hypothetical protein GUJ93_ZPchr0009g1809 [Zizania palustris]
MDSSRRISTLCRCVIRAPLLLEPTFGVLKQSRSSLGVEAKAKPPEFPLLVMLPRELQQTITAFHKQGIHHFLPSTHKYSQDEMV